MSYKFAPGATPNSYVFPTDKGWFYTVSFPNQSATFDTYPILQNSGLSFEIVFERSLLDKGEKGADPLVRETITTIISQHLQGQGVLPIYYFLCDMQDGKETGRARLFYNWFESAGLEGWELQPYDLEMPDGDLAYAGLLTHVDHPNSAQIPDAFQQFLENDLGTGKLVFRR